MSTLLTVRFPSGATEFRMSDEVPEVGDVLNRDGDSWIVEEVTKRDDGSTVVALRPRLKPVESDELDEPGEG